MKENQYEVYSSRDFPLSNNYVWTSHVLYWKKMSPSKAEDILRKYIMKKLKERNKDAPLRLYIRGISFLFFPGEPQLDHWCIIFRLFYGFYINICNIDLEEGE